MTPAAAYGVLDGLFQQALLGYVTGDTDVPCRRLVGQVHALMPLTLSPDPRRDVGGARRG